MLVGITNDQDERRCEVARRITALLMMFLKGLQIETEEVLRDCSLARMMRTKLRRADIERAKPKP